MPSQLYISLRFICDCAEAVSSSGTKYFGIQYYAECWSGDATPEDFVKLGSTKSCVNSTFGECGDDTEQCTGKEFTNMIYYIPDRNETTTTRAMVVSTKTTTKPQTTAKPLTTTTKPPRTTAKPLTATAKHETTTKPRTTKAITTTTTATKTPKTTKAPTSTAIKHPTTTAKPETTTETSTVITTEDKKKPGKNQHDITRITSILMKTVPPYNIV